MKFIFLTKLLSITNIIFELSVIENPYVNTFGMNVNKVLTLHTGPWCAWITHFETSQMSTNDNYCA